MNSGLLSFLFKKQAADKESGEMKFGLARVIKYQELKKATNSFATELGQGGYGRVYLGRAASEQLSWDVRLKIVIGAARALAFLHASEIPVIYRDFKTSNILLDRNYNPKLSDFGLAKDAPTERVSHVTTRVIDTLGDADLADFGLEENGPTDGMSHVTTRVIGTLGYVDPAYITTGHLYVKSDVYGFGAVLLEMLSGKRVLDQSRPSGEQDLVAWAKPFLADRRKFKRVMDPRLEGQYPLEGAFQASQLALKSLAGEPQNRPSMKEVVESLEHLEVWEGR